MRRNIKQLFSLFMALVMLLSLCPLSAFAEESAPGEEAAQTEVIEPAPIETADAPTDADAPAEGTPVEPVQAPAPLDVSINQVFSADSEGDGGEGDVLPPVAITYHFDDNGGESHTDNIAHGSDYVLPDCMFEAPAGYYFEGWLIGDKAHRRCPVSARL